MSSRSGMTHIRWEPSGLTGECARSTLSHWLSVPVSRMQIAQITFGPKGNASTDWSSCKARSAGLGPDNTRPYNPFPTILPSWFPSLLASLGTTLSLFSSVPPSLPPGPHCVFITIKESLPCLTIRPHYAVLRYVIGYGLIGNLAVTDAGFPCEGSPRLGWEVHEDTNTDTRRYSCMHARTHVRTHANTDSTEVQLSSCWDHRSQNQSEEIIFSRQQDFGRRWWRIWINLCSYYWWVQITQSRHSVIVRGPFSLQWNTLEVQFSAKTLKECSSCSTRSTLQSSSHHRAKRLQSLKRTNWSLWTSLLPKNSWNVFYHLRFCWGGWWLRTQTPH